MHFTAPVRIQNVSDMFNSKTLHLSKQWRDALNAAGLLDIEAATKRDFNWFEPPNKRRGGWSGVTRIVLNPDAPQSEQQAVFLKIQQNHFYTSPRTGFRKRLTFEREYQALTAISAFIHDIPNLVLFANWRQNKHTGAILITEAIDDYISLDKWLTQHGPDATRLNAVLEALANTLRQLHARKWAHFGLFPKHVFIRKTTPNTETIKLIDLEKTRKCWRTSTCIVEDCSRFYDIPRHSIKKRSSTSSKLTSKPIPSALHNSN